MKDLYLAIRQGFTKGATDADFMQSLCLVMPIAAVVWCFIFYLIKHI